jgi:hypothetical protein
MLFSDNAIALKVELARQNLERENEMRRQKEEEKKLAQMQMPNMMMIGSVVTGGGSTNNKGLENFTVAASTSVIEKDNHGSTMSLVYPVEKEIKIPKGI